MTDREPSQGAIAKYRPIAELGHGGMAQVFLALASGPAGFNKLVVLKQIREQLADDPEFLAMFLDEARLAARLNHPNVVQTNEVGGDGRRYFICMEFLEGQALNRISHRVGAARGFTLGMHVRVLVDALAGLHYAHELRDFDGTPLEVVHRDATPHNIFVTYTGQVKVVDFGIAKAASSSVETRAGVLKGKVAYMAPEQAAGEALDRRADIFSVGMILWEALAGVRLFKGMPDVAILQRLVSGAIPKPSTLNPSVLPELEAICMKALARSPSDRYATAAEMATALEAAIDASGEKGTVRDAGRLIDGIFAGERATIQKLVEAGAVAVAEARRSAGGPSLPRLEEAPTVDTGELARGRGTGSTSSSKRVDSLSDAVTGSVAARDETTGQSRKTGSVKTPSSVTLAASPGDAASTLTASTAAQVTATRPAPEGRSRLTVGLAIAALAAVATVAVVATRGGADRAPVAATAAAPRPHLILLDSSPQGAAVTEGDKTLGTTPMSLEVDPGGPQRRLVMSLDGYQHHTFMPTADDTRIVVPLSLLQQAPAVQPSTSPTPSADKPVRPAGKAPPAAATSKPQAPSDINMAR